MFYASCSFSHKAKNNKALQVLFAGLCFYVNDIWRREGDSNPRYSNPVRQFSKLVV